MRLLTRSILNILVFILPALLVGGILIFAGNVSDGFRLGGLSLFGCVLIYFAIKKHSKLLFTLSILWWLIFISDALIRASTWWLFNSDTDAYFIVQSVANTTPRESLEFIQSHMIGLAVVLITVLLCLLIYFNILSRRFKPDNISSFILKGKINHTLVIGLSIVMIGSYAIRPSRAQFPAVYWTDYYQKIESFKHNISQHKDLHAEWAHKAQHSIDYTSHFKEKQTHVLAISESITSLNLGVCGYPRETTPEISRRLDQVQIFCNAYSPYSSTINAIKAKLTDSSVTQPNDRPHESLISYAKAAGFKVYWISNQDDSYISSMFGSEATVAIYHNKRSGRSSENLDEYILPAYLNALADPNPRKLIILHLIGVHPNYENRYPAHFSHFSDDSNDQVERALEDRNIGVWVQSKRNEYDNAILYQDWLFAQFLNAIQSRTTQGFRSLTFISDHGNEVGHELDYAGHSPTTRAGYQVPIIIWHDHLTDTGVDLHKMLDTSELDQNLMQLMGLRDKTDPPQSYWLDSAYQFKPSPAWPYWQKKKESAI